MKRKFGQLMAAGVFVLAAAIPSLAPAEPRGGMTRGPSLTGSPRMTDWGGAGRMQMQAPPRNLGEGFSAPGAGTMGMKENSHGLGEGTGSADAYGSEMKERMGAFGDSMKDMDMKNMKESGQGPGDGTGNSGTNSQGGTTNGTSTQK